jgi:hypothetical protein
MTGTWRVPYTPWRSMTPDEGFQARIQAAIFESLIEQHAPESVRADAIMEKVRPSTRRVCAVLRLVKGGFLKRTVAWASSLFPRRPHPERIRGMIAPGIQAKILESLIEQEAPGSISGYKIMEKVRPILDEMYPAMPPVNGFRRKCLLCAGYVLLFFYGNWRRFFMRRKLCLSSNASPSGQK